MRAIHARQTGFAEADRHRAQQLPVPEDLHRVGGRVDLGDLGGADDEVHRPVLDPQPAPARVVAGEVGLDVHLRPGLPVLLRPPHDDPVRQPVPRAEDRRIGPYDQPALDGGPTGRGRAERQADRRADPDGLARDRLPGDLERLRRDAGHEAGPHRRRPDDARRRGRGRLDVVPRIGEQPTGGCPGPMIGREGAEQYPRLRLLRRARPPVDGDRGQRGVAAHDDRAGQRHPGGAVPRRDRHARRRIRRGGGPGRRR